MEFSGLTNERRDEPVTLELAWSQGYEAGDKDSWEVAKENMIGNSTDHLKPTPNPYAAAAARSDAPSGDALDRATELVSQYQSIAHRTLIEEIAKLIDTADAPAGKEQVNGHGALHWYTTAKRRMDQIVELEAVVRRRNTSVAELESELDGLRKNGGDNLRRAIDRATALESELRLAERRLEAADRQRREFFGHSRTANAARQELERERDRLRYDRNEAMAQKAIAETGALTTATTDTLLEELRRRLNT